MNLFSKRPLALFCALFAAAAVGGAYLTMNHIKIHLILASASVLLAALLLAVPFFLRRFHARLLTPCLALVFVGLALFQSWLSIDRKLELISSFDGQEETCTIHIKEKYFSERYLSSYRVEVKVLGSYSLKTNGKVTLPFDAEWEIGDVIVGDFVIYPTNEDPTTKASYLLSDGILLEMETEESNFSLIDHIEPDKLTKSLYTLREALSDFICEQTDSEEGQLVSSLFLNKRELLESQTVRDFRRTGTTHLLAISGMHLSVIILFSNTLLGIFGMKKKGRCISVLLITLFYLTLTGFALSACRAFLMCCFVYLSWLFQSDNDAVTSLFFSLFFILVLSPLSVYDIGMWMSVLAVLGILIAIPFLDGWREKLRRKGIKEKRLHRLFAVLSAVCISLSAALFILFPMWLVFDELSLVALPCGILLSPLVTLVLFLTPLMLFFSWFPLLSALLGRLLYLICHVILGAVSYFSSFHGITVSLGYRFFSVLIPLFSVIMVFLLIIKCKGKWQIPTAMGSALLAIFLFLCVLRIPKTDTVTADFYEQNENGILIFSAAEESVFCDLTSGSYSSVRPGYELMAARYSTEISAYVLTHYHTGHISSMTRLFSSFVVRELYIPLPQNETENSIFASLISVARKHGIPTVIYDRGTSLSFDTLSLEVSNEVYLNRSTHPTFYITASAFDKTLIYIGESAHEDEALYQDLCQRTKKAEALIFGLHGPITKENFSYPLGEGYVFLTDISLVNYFIPQNAANSKIICDTTQISLPLQEYDSPTKH